MVGLGGTRNKYERNHAAVLNLYPHGTTTTTVPKAQPPTLLAFSNPARDKLIPELTCCLGHGFTVSTIRRKRSRASVSLPPMLRLTMTKWFFAGWITIYAGSTTESIRKNPSAIT